MLNTTHKWSVYRAVAWAGALVVASSSLQAQSQEDISFVDASVGAFAFDASFPANDDREKDLAQADFDQDGLLDLVVTRKAPFYQSGSELDVLLLNVAGVFTDSRLIDPDLFPAIATEGRDVQAVDYDADGDVDVLIIPTGDQPVRLYRNKGGVGVLWAGFEDVSAAAFAGVVPTGKFCAGAFGDLTGDGLLDLYLAAYAGHADQLLVQGAGGVFADQTAVLLGGLQSTGTFGTGVEIHDIDRDGDNDIIESRQTPRILFQQSDGTFLEQGEGECTPAQDADGTCLLEVNDYMIAVGNLDEPLGTPAALLTLDMYVVGDGGDRTQVSDAGLIVPDVSISITAKPVLAGQSSNRGGNVKMADFNNDGFLDAGVSPIDVDQQNCPTVAPLANPIFRLLVNQTPIPGQILDFFGPGTLADPYLAATRPAYITELSGFGAPYDLEWIDVNGDSCLDIVAGACSGYSVHLQDTGSCNLNSDTDSRFDLLDNCTATDNENQIDVDGDGYGNLCDGDFNDDGVVGGPDFNTFRACFQGVPTPADPNCEESDMNGDGVVGMPDFNLFRQQYNQGAPGPSCLDLPEGCQ